MTVYEMPRSSNRLATSFPTSPKPAMMQWPPPQGALPAPMAPALLICPSVPIRTSTVASSMTVPGAGFTMKSPSLNTATTLAPVLSRMPMSFSFLPAIGLSG